MNLINPNVELWENEDNNMHIMRCAKVCYASDESNITPENAKKFVESKIKARHKSILKHGSFYYKIPLSDDNIKEIESTICYNPYCNHIYSKDKDNIYYLWLSTNAQYIYNNPYLLVHIKDYESDFLEFYNNKEARELCRYTFCVITQISTSRELNRVSPNAIFGSKENGITICIPYWWEHATDLDKQAAIEVWSMNEQAYLRRIANGWLPQDAKEFLPLVTATKCVYTYSVKEWRNIINLKYFGTTGKPHPNTKIIMSNIVDFLLKLKYNFKEL